MAPSISNVGDTTHLSLSGSTRLLFRERQARQSVPLYQASGSNRHRAHQLLSTRHSACQAVPLEYVSIVAQNIDVRIWGVEIAVMAAGLFIWSWRPRGWSSSAVEVGESPVHGRGLFAIRDIAAGEIIGAYPGLVRNRAQVCT
jgi:hypothetical protein